MPDVERETLELAREMFGASAVPDVVEAFARHVDRGHHLAAVAAPGAGTSALYGLALARWVEDEGGIGLVLCATRERAVRCATVAAGVPGVGEVVALPSVTPDLLPSSRAAFGTPAELLTAIRSGSLSLGSVQALMLDDASSLATAWPAVEAILEAAGAGARKVATTRVPDERFESLLTHQLPRARRWPEDLLPPPGDPDAARRGASGAPAGPPVHYRTASGEGGRLEALVAAVATFAESTAAEQAAVLCADPHDLAAVRGRLQAAGFALAEPNQPGVWVADAGGTEPLEVGLAVLFGLPARLDRIRGALGGAAHRLIVLEPGHLYQFELSARRLDWAVEPLPDPPIPEIADELARFRARVAEEIAAGDLGSSTLVLEPLFEAHGSVRVAAALASLLRRRGHTVADSPAATDPESRRAARHTWTKLYINVGKRDQVEPGDLVGAITGETSAAGAQVGKIEIRHSFSLVQIDSLVADDVIRDLSGVKLKDRILEPRFDREGRARAR